MILIFAAAADVTAREVCRWLGRMGQSVVRIDSDDPVVELEVQIDSACEEARVRTRSGRYFQLSEVRAFWYRRGELELDDALTTSPTPALARARQREWAVLRDWLLSRLEAKRSLGSWERENACTKLVQLSTARALGLPIPATHVGTSRARLVEAIGRWGPAIQKAIQWGAAGEEESPDDRAVAGTTRSLEPERLARAPERVFPRLVQPHLDKQLELRIFGLAGRFWAMALVPRTPGEVPVDARLGDLDAYFHLVPYDLPALVEAQLRALMEGLRLDTGSIDMVVDREGVHTLLEVNPSGQLDWLARACNAPIERAIAEHLVVLAGASVSQSASFDPGAKRADVPDPDFATASHRFAWVHGQRTLVRPLGKPIVRRFEIEAPAQQRAAVSRSAPSVTPPRPPGTPRLAATSMLVEGPQRTLLYDLQRGKALSVPPSFIESLRAGDDEDGLAASDRAKVLAWVRDPQRFPARSMAWEHPALITNAVIDVDAHSEHDYVALFAELAELGCEHALVRVDRADALDVLDRVHSLLEDGPAMFVEWWVSSGPGRSAAAVIDRVQRWARIVNVVMFGASETKSWLRTRAGIGDVVAVTHALRFDEVPTPALTAMFVSDSLVRESLRYNPFFHRKLAIDARGQLRNAPHVARSFGRLGDRPLREVVAAPSFAALGMIHKGVIEGCRDCELRHACMDGRVPVTADEGGYRHTSACGLNGAQG
ncbi:MvdC/MvdD family ATP grasp protein [Enhygromyxa salina]|uniref:MvdD-like pre-ATP grasp domain-containing protein n=1 Tax=Enhygromyxa salina TaxID=215803 RepID=A0A2S9YJ32_9BACT|nr:hypothetical protein [Enhygromyxa salina]PRQ05117.1 hypothetical protein ENSA7_47460 [Enhygromyxa salina]